MGRLSGAKNTAFGVLDTLTDAMLLSMIFVISCLPVITAGASFTAIYYTVNKVQRRSRGYMVKEYFRSFRDNFRQATLTWLLFLLMGAVIGGDLYYVLRVMPSSPLAALLNVFFILLAAVLLIWGGYVFPYTARFRDTIRTTLKNCFLIAVIHFPRSLLVLALLGGCAAAVYLFFPLAIILPGLVTLWQNDLLEPVFRKYMTQEAIAEDEGFDL